MAVYFPGASVVRMAGSWEELGARPVSLISCLFGAVVQLSLLKRSVPSWACNSSVGFNNAFVTPRGISDGPRLRIRIRFEPLPLTINPPMRTSLVPTCARVEMLASRAGPVVTMTLKVWLTNAPSRSVALAVMWAVPGWSPVTRRLVPLIVAVATGSLPLIAVKVSGELNVIGVIEARFVTLMGFGLV